MIQQPEPLLIEKTLPLYEPHMQGGDLIVFEGGGWLDKVIKFFTRSQLSHSGLLLPLEQPIAKHPGVNIVESTIRKTAAGKTLDGPQITNLIERSHEFQRTWWCPLSNRIRAYINWSAAWEFGLIQLDSDTYNLVELLQYVGRTVPVLDRWPLLYKENTNASVCSEYCADIWRAGGLPGLSPNQMPPQKLAELRIFEGCYQLAGTPANIVNFNTR